MVSLQETQQTQRAWSLNLLADGAPLAGGGDDVDQCWLLPFLRAIKCLSHHRMDVLFTTHLSFSGQEKWAFQGTHGVSKLQLEADVATCRSPSREVAAFPSTRSTGFYVYPLLLRAGAAFPNSPSGREVLRTGPPLSPT